MLFRHFYNHFIYPLYRLARGTRESEFNRAMWERIALSQRASKGSADIYSDSLVREHWDLLKHHLPKRPLALLDVGCGTGEGLASYRELLGSRLVEGCGVDFSQGMLDRAAQKNPTLRFERVDLMEDAPKWPDAWRGHFDLIVCHSVLHSIPRSRLRSTFTSFAHLLKPDGLALMGWWAPYFIDQCWVVPFGPNSHRHREKTVRAAMAPSLEEIPLELREVAFRTTGLRRLFAPWHPRERGLIFARLRSPG